MRTPLPIDAQLPALLQSLDQRGAAVLQAPPGTGKTTRVPPAIAEQVEGQVWVLEPRRIAARAAAARVAAERGSRLGAEVGYAIRFDRVGGPDTRVWYVTEAMLARRLARDPELRGGQSPGEARIDAVVLDEFHERSVHTDLAAAWCLQLRRSGARPDLRLLIMSATLDAENIARWLDAPVIRAEAPLFPVEIQHAPQKDDRPLDVRAASAIRAALQFPPEKAGDILVFLPGKGEIARVEDKLSGVDAEILPLHGELDRAAQDRALSGGNGRRPRVILATNVAETSVTVPGVRIVIDSGLARVPSFDPWSGLSSLVLQPISRASAAQRAGRAGRQGPGVCARLYTRAEHDARPADTDPEVLRADLASMVLELGGIELPWLTPPPPAAWRTTVSLLRQLGALSADAPGRTPLGDQMLDLPLPPRVARAAIAAAEAGFRREAAVLAASFGQRNARVVDRVAEATGTGARGLDEREVEQVLRRLPSGHAPRGASVRDALVRALWTGFPDRLGRREGSRVRLAAGGAASVEPGTPGIDGWVVVTEAEGVAPRPGEVAGASDQARVRSMTPFPADWLLDQAEVREELRWVGERVEAKEILAFGAVPLDESPATGDPEAVAALLFRHARPVAHRLFSDHEDAAQLVARVDWLRRKGMELPALDLDTLVRAGCAGCRSFSDLGAVLLGSVARAELGSFADAVDRGAPPFLQLVRKRRRIEYPADQEPFIAAPMAELFGLRAGPRLYRDTPLVLHLLAPNQRPVQVTTDLAGFWARHWPSVRQELARRYPRHPWPEDPLDPTSIAESQPVPRRR